MLVAALLMAASSQQHHSAIRGADMCPWPHDRSAASSDTNMKEALQAGEWKSPITSELIVSKGIGLGGPLITASGDLLFIESRPQEGGRQVLVRR